MTILRLVKPALYLLLLLAVVALAGFNSTGIISRERAAEALDDYRSVLESLDGLVDSRVEVADGGSHYIRLVFAAERYVDEAAAAQRLPSAISGVPVQTSVDNPPAMGELFEDGVLLRLTTDRTVYGPGERVLVTAFAENRSTEKKQFTYTQAGPLTVALVSSNSRSPYIGLRQVSLGRGGRMYIADLAAAYGDSLGAGESIAFETFWDQKLLKGVEEVEAAPGRYWVYASFAGRSVRVAISTTS